MRSLIPILLLISSTSTSALYHGSSLQAPLLPAKFGANEHSARENANHILNAVHSSMRQWGSSLHHNGMSFFLASIPEGTLLYHGTQTPERVTGMEWLAFEIEHAENFARRRGPPGGGPGRGPPGGKPPGGGPPGGRPPRDDPPGHGPPGEGQPGRGPPPFGHRHYNHSEEEEEEEEDDGRGGNLHVYRTNRPIDRLLYIDGMSAAKTNLGTLDSQDILLLNFTGGDRGMFGEEERASQLCDWGKQFNIEGYIRTEAGIEIIWCDFSSGLDFLSHNQRPTWNSSASNDQDSILEYYRAMSARYDSITASRVDLHYSTMLSAYFYPLNLSSLSPSKSLDATPLPRLLSAPDYALNTMKSDLESILSRSTPRAMNWQGAADMLVTRYTTRLPFLISSAATNESFIADLNKLLNLFVDYSVTPPDLTAAVDRCSHHYLPFSTISDPGTAQDVLLRTAFQTVAHRICDTLFQAREIAFAASQSSSITTNADVARRTPPEEAVEMVKELVEWLDWTTWKKCGTCAVDEVCVVAIWPFGRAVDHVAPSCQNGSVISGGWGDDGYWR